jgi:hypothetical protein
MVAGGVTSATVSGSSLSASSALLGYQLMLFENGFIFFLPFFK